MPDIENPDETSAVHNADVYWHYTGDPVQRAQLLGTFPVGTTQSVLLPVPVDSNITLRAVSRGGRGQTFQGGAMDATPYDNILVEGVGGAGAGGEVLENQHIALTPTRTTLNAELPFLQFRDETGLNKSQIRLRRTPTGAQNVITDFNASGDGRIYKCNMTAGVNVITVLAATSYDEDAGVVGSHPVPYYSEAAVPHSFRGGQGIRIIHPAGVGTPDFYTTITSVAGADLTLAAAPPVTSSAGALCHDDTAALNAAFQNRGHIWIPEGRYWASQRLLWPATSTGLNQQIIIEGDGEWRSVIMFHHDGNGIQLIGAAQTGNPNSGVYDAVIRNLGIWCVPDDNKEGLRPTNKGHGLAFTATSSNSGVPGPSTGNVRVENVLLQGWGRFGLWSDNLQSAFITNVKCYHNLSGGMAICGNATIRGTSQQEDNAIEITNSLIVYSGPADFGGGSDSVRTIGGGSIAAWSRTLTVSGGLTAADVGRIIKLIDGPGVGGSTHVTMIESVESGSSCTISMPVWQGASGFSVQIYQSSVANVFLHNANNVRINGGTHQGNWVGYSGDASGVRAENLDALRIDGLWEEDAGGTAGAAIDLHNVRAVNIESTHTGGSAAYPGQPPTPSGHHVGIRMTDVQGVKVDGCYLGQSGTATAFQMLGYSQGIVFENCYGADWIAGLANTAASVAGGSEPVIIGPGCHSLSFDNVQTNTLQLWDERWTNIVGNPNFLEGMVGWTTPVAGVVTQPNYPYVYLPARYERFVVVNTQALGSGLVDVLTQDIAIPDSRPVGQWTFSWDHYIQSRGAGGSTDNNTVVTIEVRTASAGYTVRSVTLTADAGYGIPTNQWMRLCIKTNLDLAAGRFFRIRFSNGGGANSPIFRVSNMRLQPGISATFDADQPITQERGGPLYAPLYFKAINPAQFPPPPPPTDAISIINVAGVLKMGQGGVYSSIGSGGVGPGTPNTLAMFGAAPGTSVVNSPIYDDPANTNGPTLFVANRHLLVKNGPAPLGADIAQIAFQTDVSFGSNYAIWRYEHRVGGMAGGPTTSPNTPGGEMQLFINGTNGGLPIAHFGLGLTYLYSDLWVSGNLDVHGVSYLWPMALPAAPATNVYLQCDAAGQLAWTTPAGLGTGGGDITGSGTGNTMAMFNAAKNITNGPITDDPANAFGPSVIVQNRSLIVKNGPAPGGADLAQMAFQSDVSFGSNYGIWRYEHRVAGMVGSINLPRGEMQLFLNDGTAPVFQVGLGLTYLASGFLIAGNLAVRNVSYVWPTATPAAPATEKYLKCNATGDLSWSTPATSGFGSLTNNKVPRWDSTAAALVNSCIEDRTNLAGGFNGTLEFDCVQLLFKRLPALTPAPATDDLIDFYMRTGVATPTSVILRHEHRPGGGGSPNSVQDTNNNSLGELQLFFNTFTDPPSIVFGSIHSWFTHGVRIRATPGNAASVGDALQIRTSGDQAAFYIDQNGNPTFINRVPYVSWPAALPSGTAKFLQCDTAGVLTWTTPASGNVGGSGTVGTLAMFVTNTTTIGNSPLTDNGASVFVKARDFRIVAPPSPTGADLAECWLQTDVSFGGSYGIWRYEHRTPAAGGCVDALNTLGEMQLFLNGNPAGETVAFGSKRSYFLNALRVKMPDTTDYPFIVVQPGGSNIYFRIDTDGGLGIIRSVNYTWPAAPLTYPTGGAAKYLGFTTTAGTPVLQWMDAPGGTGTGANTALSNLTTTTINADLNPSVAQSGLINLGNNSLGQIWGSMHMKNGVFVFPVGSSDSSPRAFGFIPATTPFSTSEATRFLIYGDRNCFQSGDKARTQIGSYFGIELRGNRQNPSAATYTKFLSAASEDTAVMLLSETNSICLAVSAVAGQTRDIIKATVGGAARFNLDAFGSIASIGGTRFGVVELQPGSNATTAIASNMRTILIDTVNGPQNLTLPSALANPGMIVEIVHIRAVQKILTPTVGQPTGYDQVVNVRTAGADVFNGWPGTDPQATLFKLSYPGLNGIPSPDNQHKIIKLIADSTYNVWWLMPYFL